MLFSFVNSRFCCKFLENIGTLNHPRAIGVESILSFALLVFLANPSQAQVPIAKERVITQGESHYVVRSRLKSLLNANFTFGYHHNHGKELVSNTLDSLADLEGWSIHTITDPAGITLNELEKYDVVVWNNISNMASDTGLSMESKGAIQIFVENGGGSFMVHGSGDAFNGDWPWYYNTLHPVGYAGHGSRTNEETFRGAGATGHSVMEGLFEGEFEITYGEWHKYNKNIYDNPNAEVLLEVDRYCYDLCFYFPGVSWVLNVGKGKNLFFPFGHDESEKNGFNDPDKPDNWNRFFTQGLYYVAGYDTLKLNCPEGYTGVPNGESCTAVHVENYSFGNRAVAFHRFHLAVLFKEEGKHKVTLTDIRGKVIDLQVLKGASEYWFSEKKLESGVYLLQVVSNEKDRQARRYFIK